MCLFIVWLPFVSCCNNPSALLFVSDNMAPLATRLGCDNNEPLYPRYQGIGGEWKHYTSKDMQRRIHDDYGIEYNTCIKVVMSMYSYMMTQTYIYIYIYI